jgi:S1-C subfamily serine protease
VPAELGVSADLVVGDPVVAIGNALDLGGPPSVTTGIVSAKGRTIAATDSLVLDDLIQTDAAINPGNSGGPLVNATGQVVGINTAIIADSENIGFSIAIDSLKPLIDDIREGRGEITPDQAFLGVSMTALDDLSDGVPEEFGVTVDAGVFVSDLVPGSAADQAGVQLGDVILEVDGTSVTEPTEVADIVHDREAGEAITIVLERSGEQVTVEATLSSRADGGG